MPELKILTESELREVVQLDLDSVACIEQAFIALAGGSVVMPPILSMAIEEFHGEVDVKTAYVPGFDSFAIKMSPGFFDNPKIGLPSTTGLMVLFSVRTGLVEAILLDNGYLTDIRTAAAGSLAARLLSKKDSKSACIIGSGRQSCLQLEALCLVRPIESATIWARNHKKAQELCSNLSEKLGISMNVATDIHSAVSKADIVVSTTPSTDSLISMEMLQPGQHVTAMGSDQAHKGELAANCFSVADLYVPDRQKQTEKLGELNHAIKAGIVSPDKKFPELGEVAAGTNQGRISDEMITICDLTGTGVQDTAIANFANQRATKFGSGFTLQSD